MPLPLNKIQNMGKIMAYKKIKTRFKKMGFFVGNETYKLPSQTSLAVCVTDMSEVYWQTLLPV
jgi:hypothetical protein